LHINKVHFLVFGLGRAIGDFAGDEELLVLFAAGFGGALGFAGDVGGGGFGGAGDFAVELAARALEILLVRSRRRLFSLTGGCLFLLGFLWGGPFDFAGEVDALCCYPLVETLVEFFIMDVKFGLALACLY
jgi:hypothetical protein